MNISIEQMRAQIAHNVRSDDFLPTMATHADFAAQALSDGLRTPDTVADDLRHLRNMLILAQKEYRLKKRK